MPSFKTPTQLQIDTAVQRMRSPEHAAYFLSRLENPNWVAPLRKNGIFTSPPPAIVSEKGIFYPHWPASTYLARMANHIPLEVADIFANFNTDNASVIGDMLKAALAMPTNVAKKLVGAVCQAAEAGNLWIYFKDACDLCVRLAEGKEVAAAIQLAEALFTPKFEEGQETPSRRDEYWYKEGLKKVVPALASRAPEKFPPKLCDWLTASVEAKKNVDPITGRDYSYAWRPAIEEHGQNRDYEFAGVMVGFVRAGFEEAIHAGLMSLDGALKLLEHYDYLIFKRMRIHLINEFAEQLPRLAQQIMMNHSLFEDFQYVHEYAMLIGHRWNLLTQEEQATWFGWIDAGPDMSDFDELFKERSGREPTEEDRQNRIRYWQFKKSHWIRKHLEGERREFYENMLSKHGKPELADLNVHVGPTICGHDSPMTVDDLAKMGFEQAVDTVSSWEPEETSFEGPNIEGLAETFHRYVATNPEELSAQASVLIDRPAIYVREFISQMIEATKAGCDIDVLAVLNLCRWVVGRPPEERTTPNQGMGEIIDKDWQWTRDEISRFIESICQAKVDSTPKYPMDRLREPMWQLINVLCHDPATSNIVHDIAEDDPRVHDYLTMGMNSPRGKAVGAALEYAHWIANHIKKTDGKNEVVPRGFEAMPEFRDMLEWQIAPDNRSFEALAEIGSRIGLIYWIDENWLAKNAGRLFNLEGIEESPPMAQGWAAWNAFLVWVNPHVEFYRLFKKQFAYAVKQAVKVQIPERSHEQPMHRLGEHLMIFYGCGKLRLDDEDELLRQFLTESVPEIRRHAIGFVGRSLKHDEMVSEAVVDRFKTLWDFYWANKGKTDAAEKPDAWLFGPWFAYGRFPELWALEQLEQFVEVVPTPEPDHAIVEQLAKIAQTDIMRAVRILDRMVRDDRGGWRIQGWPDPARRILKEAMNAGGASRSSAVQLINFLGRRGYTEYGNLLND